VRGDYLRSTEGSCHRGKFIVAVGGTGERPARVAASSPPADNRKYGPEIPAPRWNLSAMKSSHRRLLFLLILAPATVLDVDSGQALTLFTGFGFRGPFDRSETISVPGLRKLTLSWIILSLAPLKIQGTRRRARSIDRAGRP
jgi:hypothetical protein